jgi:hypothetical protein
MLGSGEGEPSLCDDAADIWGSLEAVAATGLSALQWDVEAYPTLGSARAA